MAVTCSRAALAVLVLGSVTCRPPTQVMVVITTNIACADLQGTAVIVGTPADVDTKAAGTITTTCANGRIGAIALIPGASRDASFAIKVVTGVGVLADECITTPTRPTDVKGVRGCVVARRELGFIPQTPLTLPIEIHQACIGVICSPDQTCVEGGLCTSDKFRDPLLCAGPAGCDETDLGKAGAGGSSSASSGSGATSSGTTATSTSATSSGTSSSGMGGAGGVGPTGPSSSSTGGAGGAAASASSSGTGGATAAAASSSSSGTGGATAAAASSSSSGTGGATAASGSSSGTGGTGPTGPSSSGSGTGGTGGTGGTAASGTGGTGGTAASGTGGTGGTAASGSTGSGNTKDAGVQDSGVMTSEAGTG
jgi:hypothetical protein